MKETQQGRVKVWHSGISDENWVLKKIEDPDEYQKYEEFCCGDGDLNEFIKKDAIQHKNELIVETYTLKGATSQKPVAFISFCNDSIQRDRLPKPSKKELPRRKRYPSLPAVKIARLGVCSDLQRKDIGTLLINFTKKFFTTGNRTGCRFLTVDAYNREQVIRFYEKNDFNRLLEQLDDQETVIMYLDLKRLNIG
ncbi:MAG: GNAT family N-acetyltransferase [Syntrophus sp. (in: bacteria)]